MKKETHGGKRNGAGRPKSEKKKQELYLWVEVEHVNVIGKENAKAAGEATIARLGKKLLK